MVNKFCCFSLESTAKFFGWLGCISSTVLIGLSAFGLFYTREILQALTGRYPNVEEQSFLRISLLIAILLLCIDFMVHFCLILATSKKRHNLLLPWLIDGFVGMMVYLAFMLRMEKKYVLSSIPGIAFIVYLWFCMLSLYERIKNAKQRRPNVAVDLII